MMISVNLYIFIYTLLDYCLVGQEKKIESLHFVYVSLDVLYFEWALQYNGFC